MSVDDWTRQAGEILAHHRVSVTGGQCLCGHVVPLGHSVTEHLADVLTPLVAAREAQAAAKALREAEPVVAHVACPECGEHLPVSTTTHIEGEALSPRLTELGGESS